MGFVSIKAWRIEAVEQLIDADVPAARVRYWFAQALYFFKEPDTH